METRHQPPRPGFRTAAFALLFALLSHPSYADFLLHPSPNFPAPRPQQAEGAVLWLHGSYDTAHEAPPREPPFIARFVPAHWDIWRLDRTTSPDPLAPARAALVLALKGLRDAGYRHIVVAGHSRGGFIALAALAHPDLADAVAAISPAAHGTSPEGRAQALADYRAELARAHGAMRLALVQFTDDPFDPDPAARSKAADRPGLTLLHILEPPAPIGHMGVFDPEFDRLFGEHLVSFLQGH